MAGMSRLATAFAAGGFFGGWEVAFEVSPTNLAAGHGQAVNIGGQPQEYQGQRAWPRWRPCKSLVSGKPGNQAGTMAAEKDAGLIEVILLRQHPNHTLPAIVQTSVQRKIRRHLLSPAKTRWTVTIFLFGQRTRRATTSSLR